MCARDRRPMKKKRGEGARARAGGRGGICRRAGWSMHACDSALPHGPGSNDDDAVFTLPHLSGVSVYFCSLASTGKVRPGPPEGPGQPSDASTHVAMVTRSQNCRCHSHQHITSPVLVGQRASWFAAYGRPGVNPHLEAPMRSVWARPISHAPSCK